MRKLGSVCALLAVIALLSSCFSVPSIGGFSPLGQARDAASNRASAEVSSASGMTGMQRKMMFNMLYSQIFFMGGFGADFYALEETQGAVWRVKSIDKDGKASVVEAERALLKILPTKEAWWLLTWTADGETWKFEALMGPDLAARKIRYYNADVKRVEESVFDKPGKSASNSETAPPEAAPAGSLDPKDLPKYTKGRESVKVGAGTFQTERIVWTFIDEEEKVTYTYTWWVDPKTPGGLVKYEWKKSGSKEAIQGELVSLKKGYTTKFASFK